MFQGAIVSIPTSCILPEPFLVNHHLTKLGGHRHSDSENMIFFEVEGQDSTYPRFNSSLLFVSKTAITLIYILMIYILIYTLNYIVNI